MKHLLTFILFEGLDNSTMVTIEKFLERIGIPAHMKPKIISWWNINRGEIIIHLLPFKSTRPIYGVFLENNIVVINDRLQIPPHIKLFLALHESRHCDQHRVGKFMEGYYYSVVNEDKETFLQTYKKLEKDANDFAISSMRACGFFKEMNFEEMSLRSNENAGNMVYQMILADIKKYNPTDFFDLLKMQIGVDIKN